MTKLLYCSDLAEQVDKVSETISLPTGIADVGGLIQPLCARGAARGRAGGATHARAGESQGGGGGYAHRQRR